MSLGIGIQMLSRMPSPLPSKSAQRSTCSAGQSGVTPNMGGTVPKKLLVTKGYCAALLVAAFAELSKRTKRKPVARRALFTASSVTVVTAGGLSAWSMKHRGISAADL